MSIFGKCRLRAVICLLFIVLCVRILNCTEFCSPAEEGKHYVLEHQTRVDKSLRDILWSVTDSAGKREEISHCFHENTFCYDFTWTFTPTVKRLDENWNKNILNVSIVSSDHRGMTINIENLAKDTGTTQTAYSCEMKVYSKPRAPMCEATKVTDNSINVMCWTNQTYPEAICDMYQVNRQRNKVDTIGHQSGIKYTNKDVFDSNGTKYVATSCSTRVFVPLDGRYTYYAIMTPGNLPPTVDASVTSKETDIVHIDESGVEVFLTVPELPIEVCSDQDTAITVTCDALGFDEEPEFTWKVEDLDVKLECHGKVTKGSEGPRFNTECLLTLQPRKPTHRIECTAASTHRLFLGQNMASASRDLMFQYFGPFIFEHNEEDELRSSEDSEVVCQAINGRSTSSHKLEGHRQERRKIDTSRKRTQVNSLRGLVLGHLGRHRLQCSCKMPAPLTCNGFQEEIEAVFVFEDLKIKQEDIRDGWLQLPVLIGSCCLGFSLSFALMMMLIHKYGHVLPRKTREQSKCNCQIYDEIESTKGDETDDAEDPTYLRPL